MQQATINFIFLQKEAAKRAPGKREGKGSPKYPGLFAKTQKK